jgi:hypothetical protein
MTGHNSDDPIQKIQYFKKLIKFKNRDEDNEVVSFVPHHLGNRNTKTVVEVTTESDSGNRFAYDTVNNNEEFDFAGNNDSISGQHKNNYEVVERSSPEPKANIINENNEKQEATTSFDVIKNLSEGSLGDISNSSDVDMNINLQTESSIASKNESKSTSAEKNSKDYEIQRFISEHIKYKSNNVTIKKSWGKWSAWSSCSRSCGEGVMSQMRECMEKT